MLWNSSKHTLLQCVLCKGFFYMKSPHLIKIRINYPITAHKCMIVCSKLKSRLQENDFLAKP